MMVTNEPFLDETQKSVYLTNYWTNLHQHFSIGRYMYGNYITYIRDGFKGDPWGPGPGLPLTGGLPPNPSYFFVCDMCVSCIFNL